MYLWAREGRVRELPVSSGGMGPKREGLNRAGTGDYTPCSLVKYLPCFLLR